MKPAPSPAPAGQAAGRDALDFTDELIVAGVQVGREQLRREIEPILKPLEAVAGEAEKLNAEAFAEMAGRHHWLALAFLLPWATILYLLPPAVQLAYLAGRLRERISRPPRLGE